MDEICRIPEEPVCEIQDDLLREIFANSKTIAIVGLSDNPERDSHIVARYLIDKGFVVLPVNPQKSEILGLMCYPDLASIGHKIDIVNVFRNLEAIPAVVREAISLHPGTIWLQLGLVHNESAVNAMSEGIHFIQTKCIKIEHERLFCH